jgi:hypothetical protein
MNAEPFVGKEVFFLSNVFNGKMPGQKPTPVEWNHGGRKNRP